MIGRVAYMEWDTEMSATVHGRNMDRLPVVEERFRAVHRDDAITVHTGQDGWSVTCGWWHTTPDLTCIAPPGRAWSLKDGKVVLTDVN